MYSNKNFGAALTEIIKQKKIKLRSLAGKTNLNYSYFSKLKKRKGHPPISTIELISGALDIPPEYFMEYRIYKIDRILKNNPDIINRAYNYLTNLLSKEKLKVAERKKSFTDK
jgi:transcriptional regulator with XRE-family HTH domain